MSVRQMPDVPASGMPQFAGSGIASGGGGGGGGTSSLANKTDLTAIILTGTTNTSGGTISAGTWFYLNGVLVKAKVDIASNATFTLNTNYEEKTIGSALSELNSKNKLYTHWFENLTVTANERYMISNAKELFGIPSSVSAWDIIALNAGSNGYNQGNSIDYNVRDVIYTQNDVLSFVPSVSDATYGIQLALMVIR